MPAWHETVFPPYFVAGAIFSGFAMVILLCVPIRHFYHLKEFITIDHLDVMGKLLLATSLLTSYGYLSEQSLSWYAHDSVEWCTYWFRLIGLRPVCPDHLDPLLLQYHCAADPLDPAVAPQGIGVGGRVAAGAGGHVAGALHDHHHQPEPRLLCRRRGAFFKPTIWDIATYAGSVGVFLVAFLLFARFLPILSMSETRALLPGAHGPEVGR